MKNCFKVKPNKKIVIGMVHISPIPGTPLYKEESLEEMKERAVEDCLALKKGGATGALIQSVDVIDPNTDDCDYIRVAVLAAIAAIAKRETGEGFLLGAQLLWNCITPSLAVCRAAGIDFTRCSCLVGETDAICGHITGNPFKVAEYRKKIGAEGIAMTNEVYGYHCKGQYDSAQIRKMAKASEYMGATAIEVMHSDLAMNEKLIKVVRAVTDLPIILGGGTTIENCVEMLRYADGAFVGGAFQSGKGDWGGGHIQEEKVAEYMYNVRLLEQAER